MAHPVQRLLKRSGEGSMIETLEDFFAAWSRFVLILVDVKQSQYIFTHKVFEPRWREHGRRVMYGRGHGRGRRRGSGEHGRLGCLGWWEWWRGGGSTGAA